MSGVLRDIARGGLAGLIVGVLLAGVGGRLVMRFAALVVPGSAGALTENGNVIGEITLAGTIALVVLIGLLFGAVAGSTWVVISPWLPASPVWRAVVAVPIAFGLGTPGLIDDRNPDFAILGRDPLVIAVLVALVGLFGPGLVLADRWLDGRLPHPREGRSPAATVYTIVAVIGTLLTVLLVLPLFLGSGLLIAGIALIVVGLSTLGAWLVRVNGEPAPPAWLSGIARSALAVATVAGIVVAAGEVAGALGVG